ncbi:MAG: hypothetical protein SXQ77_12315 [Halobacteria archaeon]|nr:hypothetical protein [Halobacteria archaeon]
MKQIDITSEEASVAGTALVNTAGEDMSNKRPAEPETTTSPLSDDSGTLPIGGLLDKLLALTQGKMDEQQAEEIYDALVL